MSVYFESEEFDDYEALDRVAQDVYENAAAHGFHEGETIGEVSTDRMAKFTSNLHGEVSELWEAERKAIIDKPCDKTPELTNGEEEIADIIIRALDTAYSKGYSVGRIVRAKAEYNRTRPHMHGKVC